MATKEPTTVLFMDPGLRHCGLALFHKRQMVWSSLAKNKAKKERGPAAWVAMAEAVVDDLPAGTQVEAVVTEYPEVYKKPKKKTFHYGRYGGRQEGGSEAINPNDLLELSGVVGAVCAKLGIDSGLVLGYLPKEWKGQTHKKVTKARMFEILEAPEVSNLPSHEKVPEYLRHNVYDAVALGLHHLGRQPRP